MAIYFITYRTPELRGRHMEGHLVIDITQDGIDSISQANDLIKQAKKSALKDAPDWASSTLIITGIFKL